MLSPRITATATAQPPAGGLPIDLTVGYASLPPLVEFPPDLYARLAATPLRRLQEEFLHQYCAVSGEPVDADDALFFLTASQAIGAVAGHLAATGVRRIGVPEPTFDNLPGLLRGAGLEPVPVAESDEALLAAVAELEALFLVLPNNPTGWRPSDRCLAALPAAAKRSGCRVVIDRTCRFHQERQFPQLLAADFDWIGVEDTGKTWSTAGTKVALVRARSSATLAALADALDTQLKHVPALNLFVVTEAIAREGGTGRVRSVVSRNRAVLGSKLARIGYSIASEPLGVALLRLPADSVLGSTQLSEKLLAAGIEVMPGSRFFWNSPDAGEAFLRVSLVRPTGEFSAQVTALVDAIAACG